MIYTRDQFLKAINEPLIKENASTENIIKPLIDKWNANFSHKITFESGKAKLDNNATSALNALMKVIISIIKRGGYNTSLRLVGYTDDQKFKAGSNFSYKGKPANAGLANMRADSVLCYLIDRAKSTDGLSAGRLKQMITGTSGVSGADNPDTLKKDASGNVDRDRSRRVEIQLDSEVKERPDVYRFIYHNIILDTSSSMNESSKIKKAISAVKSYIEEVVNRNDKSQTERHFITLSTFSGVLANALDPKKVLSKLDNIKADGGTPLYGSIVKQRGTYQNMIKERSAKEGVVGSDHRDGNYFAFNIVTSDGDPTDSEKMQSAKAVINSINKSKNEKALIILIPSDSNERDERVFGKMKSVGFKDGVRIKQGDNVEEKLKSAFADKVISVVGEIEKRNKEAEDALKSRVKIDCSAFE